MEGNREGKRERKEIQVQFIFVIFFFYLFDREPIGCRVLRLLKRGKKGNEQHNI
jgi:hypothetical protein